MIERIEGALREEAPFDALVALAKALKSEGMAQSDMYEKFEIVRAKCAVLHSEREYDAILDALDIVVGWCPPELRLYETELRR